MFNIKYLQHLMCGVGGQQYVHVVQLTNQAEDNNDYHGEDEVDI